MRSCVSLHVTRTPSVRLLRLVILAMPSVERHTGDVVIRNRRGELRQVLGTLVGDRLEPRRQRDQFRLTEGRTEEGNPEWNPKHVRRRHLHVWIAARSSETRAAEHE